MTNAQPKVVVIGSGFAGLESAFYLRHRVGDAVDITLISDQDHFLFKPNIIYIPFGADPNRFRIDLGKPARKKDIHLRVGRAREIDQTHNRVQTDVGSVDYDHLIIATGADMRPGEIPGLAEHALTPWTIDEMLRLKSGLERMVERTRTGSRQRILFLVPPNNKCSGPLYELVMMVDTWLRKLQVRSQVDITWSTFEESYIQAFGPRLNTVVTDEFEEREVRGFKGYIVTGVEPGRVHYQNGSILDYDLLVSFPPYVARESFAGLPTDDRGFISVEPDSRRVRNAESIFAVGDASDFPVKQAFLALLQGDAAAEQIAAKIQKRQPELRFEPMSMCVMEELNKATFAQVPLEYTNDPLKPVTVDIDDTEHYKVGVSPLWRVGKKVLGIYLPWRFASGEPFHAGFAWDAMDMGLKVMSRLMAR